LIKVGGAGICRTDLQMIDGYFREYLDLELPCIPGHEIAGWVEEIGNLVPENFIKKGDLVVVYGGWGCGIVHSAKVGTNRSVVRESGRDSVQKEDIRSLFLCLRTNI
jgi:propanol-preferring alcohol dehydrogenase